MVQKIFKIGNKLQPKKGDKYENVVGEVVNVKDHVLNGKHIKKYLLKGDGLNGAAIVDDYCKECKQAIIKKMPGYRWYYDFCIEEVK